MSLTDDAIKQAQPRARGWKLHDREGLYCFISPSGGRLWRFDFQHAGRRKTLSLGRWPAIKVADARKRRSAAQALLGQGVDPCADKQARKRAAPVERPKPTFEEAARAWHRAQGHRWTPAYGKQVLERLTADVFPAIGSTRFPIPRGDILACLRAVEARGVRETTRRLRQYVGAVHRFAGAEDDSIVDTTAMLRGALQAPPPPKHHPKIRADQLGDFLSKLRGVDAEPETKLAIRFTILTAARTAETIGATWAEIEHRADPRKALWRVPAERMKMDTEHLVPLSKPVLALLRELHEISGDKPFLFPAPFDRRGRHMSNMGMLTCVYRMGHKGRATVHGMRGMFSTWANESGFNSDVVELCLSHDDDDRVRAAYNSAQRLPERRALLQSWAEFVERQSLIG